ncbi:MAG TPA: PhaM family polyhydroxyalkanoate granule multifunctional regulatory protein [Usitatibacter sp.]|nr:PhaM family polyhydroxyalkanoate granule multifunctional regulatory protein [Usitatibacter sp.]
MSKPVTPQEMFDLWQKMVNPGAYPLQSLMFPVLDSKELDKKIAELEVVEHWLKANVNMVALTIKSLQFQRDMVKGGEKAVKDAEAQGEIPNPAMWAWNMMADAAKAMPQAPAAPPREKAKKRARKR